MKAKKTKALPAKSKKTNNAAIKKAPVKKALKQVSSKTKAKAPAKKPALKKPAAKASIKPAKKAAVQAKAAPKQAVAKALPSKVVALKAPTPKPSSKKKSKSKLIPEGNGALRQQFVTKPIFKNKIKLTPFLAKQRQRLLQLKDTLLDSMTGVARGNLHAGSETSAFGMHQADAGSDAYDRDFALSILSQEQNSLYEIDAALKRIDDGNYGQCENCNKPIRHDRLEALPFTRYTVECQAELEKRQHHQRARLPINSLFGLTEEEAEGDEEETTESS